MLHGQPGVILVASAFRTVEVWHGSTKRDGVQPLSEEAAKCRPAVAAPLCGTGR
jgi:hypothetical protein